ncbi:MAG: reductase [Limosilactobacillus sp.]|uniref:reductase n=1 Tax=Limosilactobacillus sp. TaxID=2773925 RepID=UPI0025C5AD9F|nr:reductase [Limosilactobacillus sp.]MCI1975021.1 reductase [Limosilactobacillus sp.]MCI2031603.1 reductase [Limosilactobacillus sp.]
MLVRYRKDYQKIAMGLLSFLPELRDYDQLADAIENSLAKGYQIYLWKDTEDNHFIGIIIIEVGKEYVLVRQLSFTPTERSGKNVYALLTAIYELHRDKRLMGTLKTQPLISNWERNNEK